MIRCHILENKTSYRLISGQLLQHEALVRKLSGWQKQTTSWHFYEGENHHQRFHPLLHTPLAGSYHMVTDILVFRYIWPIPIYSGIGKMDIIHNGIVHIDIVNIGRYRLIWISVILVLAKYLLKYLFYNYDFHSGED